MSSIRDALKRAERERQSRSPASGGVHRDGTPETATEVSTPSQVPMDQDLPKTEIESSSLSVVDSDVPRVVDVPIEFAEELTAFRHGIESALPKAKKCLLMSSATAGEGVTTLTNFLAASLAVRDGRKTCLVDANFKSPKTTRMYGLLGKPGFSDYCAGRSELLDALHKTESPDLFIMGLGTEVYNPSLILSHERARGLPQELLQRFDYVLFDASSLLGSAEAGMMAAMVDGVVLVVRANHTKREVLVKAEKMVRFGGGRVVGTILNRRTFPIPDAIYKRL